MPVCAEKLEPGMVVICCNACDRRLGFVIKCCDEECERGPGLVISVSLVDNEGATVLWTLREGSSAARLSTQVLVGSIMARSGD